MIHKTAIALAFTAAASVAHAASTVTLFKTNFDTIETQTIPETTYPVTDRSGNSFNLRDRDLAGWTITGVVDLVIPNGGFGFSVLNCGAPDPAGRCLDLAGSTTGFILSDPISFAANRLVTVSFDVSGSQRISPPNIFAASASFESPVGLESIKVLSGPSSFSDDVVRRLLSGGPAYQVTLPSEAPFVTYAYSFLPTSNGSFRIRFGTPSLGSRGPVLDNVLVTQVSGPVPEPAAWAMLIAGFGLVGAARRRVRYTQSSLTA